MNEQTPISSQEVEEVDNSNDLSSNLFGWVEGKYTSLIILIALILLSVILIAVDWQKGKGFYGLFGFIAFSFAVLSGWPLGSWLRRRSSYYNDEDEELVEEEES